MRVAIVVPPFLPRYSHSSRNPAVSRSGTIYYPIFPAYGAAGLRRAGHETLIIDAPAEGIGEAGVSERLSSFRPDRIVFDIAVPSADSDLGFARRIAPSFGIPLILGGPYVSSLPEETEDLFPEASLIIGEYDEALVAAVESSSPGRFSIRLKDLDRYPFVSEVYSDLPDLRRYFYACSLHPVIAILGSRGCPCNCIYCHWPGTMTGRIPRSRSPEQIVEELRYIERYLPFVKEVFFEDDTFNYTTERAMILADEIIKAGVRIRWSANFRPSDGAELLPLLARAGCRLVLSGCESGDDKVLADIGKGISTDDIRRFHRAARDAGLLVHACFVMGLPGETEESARRTIDFAIELDPDTAQFLPYMPYPGTGGAGYPRTSGTGEGGGFLDLEGRHLGDPVAMERCRGARRAFYGRPGYILRKALQSLRSPGEFRRNFKAFSTFYRTLREDRQRDGSPTESGAGLSGRSPDNDPRVW